MTSPRSLARWRQWPGKGLEERDYPQADYLRRARAARLYGVGDLRVDEVERPQIEADDQVLIRVHACGICPSDLRAYTGLRPASRPMPYTPGHEWVGEVIETTW